MTCLLGGGRLDFGVLFVFVLWWTLGVVDLFIGGSPCWKQCVYLSFERMYRSPFITRAPHSTGEG